MQTALPSTLAIAEPATYNYFDAPTEYRDLNQKPPKVQKEVQYQISNNPNGGTVIQTETPSRFEAGSFRGKVGNLITRTSERIGFANDTSSRWGLYQIPEPLFGEFRARVINGLNASSGYLFVSQGHLCFSSFTDKFSRAMKLIVPFNNIARIGLAHRLRNVPGTAVNLTPMTSMSMTADAIQIFTRDGVTHQFFGLKKKTESLFNLLNHTWGLATGIIPINPANQTRTLELQQAALYENQFSSGQYPTQGQFQQGQLVQGQTHYANNSFPEVPVGHTHNPLDRNHDGVVNAADLRGNQGLGYNQGLAGQPLVGQQGVHQNPLDRNHDGVVNAADLRGNQGLGYNQGLAGQPLAGETLLGHHGLVQNQGVAATHNPLDRNHDGVVNAADLSSNQTGYTQNPLDRNHDGKVNLADLSANQTGYTQNAPNGLQAI